MPWKRENGNIVIGESGNPVFVYPDGNEIDFDADQQVVKIRELTEKAAKRKTALETSQAALEVLSNAGVDTSDPDSIREYIKTAKKNAETVNNFNDSDFVKADKVEEIKRNEAKRYEDQIRNSEENFKKQLTKKEEELSGLNKTLHRSVVKNAFLSSEFIKNRTAYPTADIAYRDLGDKFKVEVVNGEPVAFGLDRDGNKIYSLKSPTEFASAHEAIEIIINSHPQKDSLLLADGGGGGAESGKKTTISGQKVINKNDRNAFSSNIEKIASGEVKVNM